MTKAGSIAVLVVACLMGPACEASSTARSPGTAFLLSALVPGLGECYAGSPSRGRVFLLAEAGIWASFGAFRSYASIRNEDARLLAASRAHARAKGALTFLGTTPSGLDYSLDYMHDIEFYESRADFNRRSQWESGPEAHLYPEIDLWQWSWENAADRLEYRRLRNSERTARARSVYSVGAALLNRLVSGLDAARLARGGTLGRGQVHAVAATGHNNLVLELCLPLK